jgi:hypothetical protein
MTAGYGPHWPSFWTAVVAAVCCGLALVVGVVAPERSARVRRALWVLGGEGFVLTLVLFAVERLPFPYLTR